MSDEWGPWIKHDGKGCPCIGQYAHVVHKCGTEQFSIVTGNPNAWEWDVDPDRWSKIVKYRIRKPRAMLILEEILARIPDLVDAN